MYACARTPDGSRDAAAPTVVPTAPVRPFEFGSGKVSKPAPAGAAAVTPRYRAPLCMPGMPACPCVRVPVNTHIRSHAQSTQTARRLAFSFSRTGKAADITDRVLQLLPLHLFCMHHLYPARAVCTRCTWRRKLFLDCVLREVYRQIGLTHARHALP